MNATALKRWLQRGDFEKLENVVLEGRGARLLGETSPDLRTRVFLKGLPNYLTKISKVHEAVSRGSLTEVQHIVADEPKKKLAIAKDRSGTPLIHKAVYHDQPHIVEWLVNNYPITTQQKDKEGRTALHYCTACRNPESIWDILVEGGCDASVCDKRGNPAAYYLEHSSEIELSESWKMAKRKINSSKENLDIKPSNIRIWIHNRDIGKLQHVLWEGHGLKLRCETSNNPRVRKFLEAVPFIMVTIKDIHTAVVNNDLEGFRKKLEEPISPIVLCSKDSNGLNVLHKAAGLGFMDIARDILERYQTIVNVQDNDGKTPLHYAAAVKDDGAMYDLLMEYEADGSILDNKQKAAAFYKNRPSDVDPTNLTIIPEAPRVSGTTYPKNWDWRILEVDDGISRGMRKVVSSTEIDSAFGSTDSAMKSLDGSSKEISEIQNDEEEHREVEKEGVEEEEEEEEEEEVQQQKEGEEEEEEEEEKEDQEEEQQQQQEEEKNEKEEQEPEEEQEQKSSSDDDVVTGGMTNEEETAEPEVDANEKLISNNEERNDPSTGDSGVDAEEDQVIVGEHRELPEAELTGHSMAIDKEVVDLLDNGNMEQLAALVLNGDGRRLVGRQSSNPELQAFIDNVPAYMGKIHAVHMAAKEGNLRDLQNALDRRKFAVARDSSSPHGATPLHVAVIFGSTAVIRYLAGRFPETTQAIDIDGRTPLHYAATLADNGHYYNLLLHLGANPLLQDNFGQKADFYKDNQEDLSHKKLLRDFGAPENLADRMLEDKVAGGDLYSARRDVGEPETLATLERCFRLLAGARRGSTTMPKTPSSGTLLSRCLRRPVFDSIKHRVTRMDHNLFDVIWPSLKRFANTTSHSNLSSGRSTMDSFEDDVSGGVVAPDYECYHVFSELLDPLIRDLHCVTVSGELPDQPGPSFFGFERTTNEIGSTEREAVAIIESYNLDPSGKFILAGVIECCRNLENYSLPLTLTVNQLENVEREITSVLMSPEVSTLMAEGSSEDEAGTYFTLSEILDQPNVVRAQLAASGLLLPLTDFEVHDEKRLHGKHWPYGRGVYVASAGDLAAWINVQDHLRIICKTSDDTPGVIGRPYVKMAYVMRILDERMTFKRHEKLGFLTARPYALGNTLRFTMIVKLPELSKEPDNLKHLCVVRGLFARETARKDTVKIGNQQCLTVTELQTLQDFSRATMNILTLEKELVLNNSLRIANLIAGIFRKRSKSIPRKN